MSFSFRNGDKVLEIMCDHNILVDQKMSFLRNDNVHTQPFDKYMLCTAALNTKQNENEGVYLAITRSGEE